jgi:hypothetical protein
VHTAVADVEAAGGKAVAVVGDVRKEDDDPILDIFVDKL